MQLVGGPQNNVYLRDILEKHVETCTRVRAAVAYANRDNLRLFEACKSAKRPLEYYGRYDGSVPVDPPILKWFLDQVSPNLICRLIPDILHAKVIWWVNAGLYVGSANLSDRAWMSNIELGTFQSQEELIDLGLESQLAEFFETLDGLSHPLTNEIYLEQARLASERAKIELLDHAVKKDFQKRRLLPRNEGLTFTSANNPNKKAFEAFSREWNATLETMRTIGRRLSSPDVRPAWIDESVPRGVHADQFLHAYYYKRVKSGSSHPYEEFYERNAGNPEAALVEAFEWWRASDFDHAFEQRTIGEWAPEIRRALSRDRILQLSREEFISAISKVHAIRDYAAKQENEHLGLPNAPQVIDDKVYAYGEWLWSQRNADGRTVLEVLARVIWGAGAVAERLWEGIRSTNWSFPRMRESTLGEIVGWARPDEYPPRNMRTSKGLRALGYNVRVDN